MIRVETNLKFNQPGSIRNKNFFNTEISPMHMIKQTKIQKATNWLTCLQVNIRVLDLQDKIVKATLKNDMVLVYRLTK